MTECPDEKGTRHYGGQWGGYGPVRDSETVIFAVFAKTKRSGDRLAADSFDNGRLRDENESIARLELTTRRAFTRKVVNKGEKTKGPIVGIASVNVAALRQLQGKDPSNVASDAKRVICVLDCVERGDIQSHGTLGYAKWIEAIDNPQWGHKAKERNIGIFRSKIRLQLAEIFGQIKPIEHLRWARQRDVLVARVRSIRRVASAR